MLTGAAAINGAGNELNNIMYGNRANKVLDGKAGVDTMYGGGPTRCGHSISPTYQL